MSAKSICILGSTGSIGTQTVEVAQRFGLRVAGLTANSNISLLEEQVLTLNPDVVAVADEAKAAELSENFRSRKIKTSVLAGAEGVIEVARMYYTDVVVNALVGIAGLRPTLAAIESGKDVALANKETLVAGGNVVTRAAKERGVKIVPIDSEHSAIFQCLQGNAGNVFKILLTASGGPFRGRNRAELASVTREQALAHPNWSMGAKVTIDSSTLMNKGLEVIEAKWLFGTENIQVVVHPQSVIHSMVEFADSAVVAQLGLPDMRVPIQYALTYPARVANDFPRLNFFGRNLTFEEPDLENFPCLRLAYDALETGGTMPAVMNAANEVAVDAFLRGEISYLKIAELIEKVMSAYNVTDDKILENILEADREARKICQSLLRY